MWLEGRGRTCARLGIDLAWVALSPFIALLIRDNFIFSIQRHQALIPYALLCVVSAGLVFAVARLQQTVWRYISLPDILHLIAGVAIALLVALVGSFIFNRLEGVARSLPVIQWLVLLAAMIGTRIVYTLLQERIGSRRWQSDIASNATRHVLVVGITPLTELYMRSIAEFGPTNCAIVGILSREVSRGRLLRRHRILGAPEDVQKVIAELELHGVAVERIIVTQSVQQLSKAARQELLVVERSSAIEVDWLVERLRLREGPLATGQVLNCELGESQSPPAVEQRAPWGRRYAYGRYGYVKRAIDIVGASCLLIALGPFLALASLLVAIDVGLPVLFWQQRPGRHGRAFKLYKFRTMRAGYDSEGNRISDESRSSKFGRLLRRCRIDELPQLYNVLMGEMSFVGPRPLLPLDQPKCQNARLTVRPGLTGWAQVNGGRNRSPEDKATLDTWYIANASLRLDLEILLRTLAISVLGDRENSAAVKDAHAGLENREPVVGNVSYDPLGGEPSPAQAMNG